MQALKTSEVQRIVNKCNSMQNFTYRLSNAKTYSDKSGYPIEEMYNEFGGRYIVTYKVLYTGKNPSTDHKLNQRIKAIIESPYYDSIGGWLDPHTKEYYVGGNLHFSSKEWAKSAATLRKQKAIFDAKEGRTIYITKDEQ
jgi:hypothetical protein